MITKEEIIHQCAKNRALYGSNVSMERVAEIMNSDEVIEVTHEEAAACDIDNMVLTDDLLADIDIEQLTPEEAFDIATSQAFKVRISELLAKHKK